MFLENDCRTLRRIVCNLLHSCADLSQPGPWLANSIIFRYLILVPSKIDSARSSGERNFELIKYPTIPSLEGIVQVCAVQ